MLALLGMLVSAPVARADDTVTIDFETGPAEGTPITNEYLASAFTEFHHSDAGFRPYRRSVGVLARSGTVVADVGSYNVCQAEAQAQTPPTNCGEFFIGGTTGRLNRAANSVTLYVGMFASTAAANARLQAWDAGGNLLATSAEVPLDANGFNEPVTVTSATGGIARFTLDVTGESPSSADIGFDDLTLTFPATATPDASVSLPTEPITVLQGASVEVPVTITRIDGSNGPLTGSVTGLPDGVTGTVVPNPVPGTEGAATLVLSATDSAPASVEHVQGTLTLDPQGNAAVAPGPRTASFLVRVRSSFDMSRAEQGTVLLPHCAAVETGLRVQRNIEFGGTVSLTAEGMPPGVAAEFVPSATVPPGGNLIAEPRLRLSAGSGTTIPQGSAVLVRARSPGAPDRTVFVPIGRATPTATLETQLGFAPMRGGPGTEIRMTGNGFCAGTRLYVGNTYAEVTDATVEPGGTALRFRIPRTGTTAPVEVVPPGTGGYRTTNTLDARSFRSHYGFQFDNVPFEHLSFGELTDLVGPDEMFQSVNPCWPWGECRIPTGIPDPWAYVTWGVLELSLRASGGHCFGINRTLQELMSGRVKYAQFSGTATRPFDLGSASGMGGSLDSWIDSRHAAQGTTEFITYYMARSDKISVHLNRVRNELAAGRFPGVTMKNGLTEGHVVTAYDVEDQPDGGVKIYVYDNNHPFTPDEITDGKLHRDREVAQSVIEISPGLGRWESDALGWSGGNDGSFISIPFSAIPANPTLPSLWELRLVGFMFGSANGAARTTGPGPGGDILPALDSAAVPGTGGFVAAPLRSGEASHTLVGLKDGSYSQVVTTPGFVGGVRGVATAKGVTDTLTGDPASKAVAFSGERERPLVIELAAKRRDGARSATLRTTTFRRGGERVRFANGRLVYVHRGPATAFSFDLAGIIRGRTPVRFRSGKLRIRPGDRVTIRPRSWKRLSRVRMHVRGRDGSGHTRTLRNRARNAVRIALGRPRVRRGRATVRVALRRVPPRAAGGVVLRLVRSGRTVAKRAVPVRRARAGKRTFRWRLPRAASGRYRLFAHVAVTTGAPAPSTSRAARSARVRVR